MIKVKMKKIVCLVFVFSILPIFSSVAEKLTVGWEVWYPYQFRGEQQKLIGLDFDILNAINKELNFTLSYVELPWKRHLQYVKIGEVDVAMGASYAKERDKYAYITNPYRVEKVNLFVKKGAVNKIKLKTLANLIQSSYVLGIEGGYFYGNNFQTLNQQSDFKTHINEVIDLEQNVKMLLSERIDGFLADPIAVKAFAEKYSVENEFEIHPVEIYQTDIHFMLSKTSCSIQTYQAFNKAIDKLKATGELAKIINAWTVFN